MQGTISRRLWAKAGAERIPLTGAFELLPICNFACKMCYVRKSRAEVEKAGGLMNGKRWLEIAEDAAKCGLLFPLLTGGEPFLYEDFQEVFAGMQDLGMQVSINSNASLIDQNMARWLGRHTPTRINITQRQGQSSMQHLSYRGSADIWRRMDTRVIIICRTSNAALAGHM